MMSKRSRGTINPIPNTSQHLFRNFKSAISFFLSVLLLFAAIIGCSFGESTTSNQEDALEEATLLPIKIENDVEIEIEDSGEEYSIENDSIGIENNTSIEGRIFFIRVIEDSPALFTMNGNSSELVTMHADGANLKSLTSQDEKVVVSIFPSPSGNYVAYKSLRVREDNIVGEFSIINQNGEEITINPFESDGFYPFEVSWSPDENWLAFADFANSFSDIYVIDRAGGEGNKSY